LGGTVDKAKPLEDPLQSDGSLRHLLDPLEKSRPYARMTLMAQELDSARRMGRLFVAQCGVGKTIFQALLPANLNTALIS